MDATGVHVDAIAYGIGRTSGMGVLGVSDSELAFDDQVSRQAAMAVRTVMCIAAQNSCGQPASLFLPSNSSCTASFSLLISVSKWFKVCVGEGDLRSICPSKHV